MSDVNNEEARKRFKERRDNQKKHSDSPVGADDA
jgi:hypothetical protein